MKRILFIIGLFLFLSNGYSQQPALQKCGTIEYMEHIESNHPGYIQSTKEAFNVAQSYMENGYVQKSNNTYRIPVVVHIVYNTPEQNIPDSVVHNQIATLNEDFNRQNADTVNMRTDFQPYAGSMNISFELAEFDPNGDPTDGITRTQTDTTTFSGNILEMMSGDMTAMENVKTTSTGGIDPWDQTHYLNIWVCNMAINFMGNETPAILGYATPPANLPNWPSGGAGGLGDGVVIQYQVFGSNNPNALPGQQPYIAKGRTPTHEVGHYLGLRHIWGDDADCGIDDGIADTPNATAQSEQDCNKTKNSCVDNIDGVDLPDMVENYMDYSAEDCQNTFTKGQADLMTGVLENQRWDLTHGNPALNIQEETSLDLVLYPNPTNSKVTLTSKQSIKGFLVISDLKGQVVKSVMVNSNKTTIDVEGLQNGVYFVSVEGKRGVTKFVKM